MFLPVVKPIVRIVLQILSLILFALTILAAYGGRVDPDIFTLPAILTLILPALAILTVVASIMWFTSGHIFMGALGVVALLCSWSPISTVSPFGSSEKATPGAQTFTVMSWNIKHAQDQELKDPKDPTAGNRTIDYILHSGADIVCVQELDAVNAKEIHNLTPALKDSLKQVYPYWGSNPVDDQKVFSKYPLKHIPSERYLHDWYDGRRYSFYDVKIGDRHLTLINMHMTSFALDSTQQRVITEMKSVGGAKKSIKEMKGGIYQKLKHAFKVRKKDTEVLLEGLKEIDGPLVICGDMNDVPESYVYRMLRGADLKDAYVETGFGPLVTFNQHMFWFHLDQVFYRGPLKALSVKKGKIKSSDHYPLTAEFEFE